MNVPKNQLADKFAGCILGGAIGDALGSPTEGRTPDEIKARFGGRIEDFAPPFDPARPDGRHKGDGHVTDDTLMVIALCKAYLAKGAQLEAHDMATYFMAEFADNPMWIPEYGREMPLIERAFYPEKYMFLRLRLASADPRTAGVGNMVNCGAAMYASPVGMMNACDPDMAYLRAAELFGAHQSSYGLEAAAVMAACVAEALRPNATVESVVKTALRLAKDGTHDAIAAVSEAAAKAPPDEGETRRMLRAAIEPYDTVKGGIQDFKLIGSYPSRLHSIEELPIALGYLIVAGGDFRNAVLGAVNYGRDADSIAGMAGAISGALCGRDALPKKWVATVTERNRIDFDSLAARMFDLFIKDHDDAYSRAVRVHREIVESAGLTQNDQVSIQGDSTP